MQTTKNEDAVCLVECLPGWSSKRGQGCIMLYKKIWSHALQSRIVSKSPGRALFIPQGIPVFPWPPEKKDKLCRIQLSSLFLQHCACRTTLHAPLPATARGSPWAWGSSPGL